MITTCADARSIAALPHALGRAAALKQHSPSPVLRAPHACSLVAQRRARRDELSAGGYETKQSSDEWTLHVQFKAGLVEHDHLRVAVSKDGGTRALSALPGPGRTITAACAVVLWHRRRRTTMLRGRLRSISRGMHTVLVHVAGQEDVPLLGGVLQHEIDPAGCRWRIRKCKRLGNVAVEEMVITLKKASAGGWRDLLQAHYV